MRILIACLALAGVLGAQAEYDFILRGGFVVDGTGSPPRKADVAVREGRIAAVGNLAGVRAARVIDVSGRVVAPGFIDVHTHADRSALKLPAAQNFILMGVTTIVTGNCGSSVLDLAEHFRRVEEQGISVNYASLIGHGTVRRQVMGTARRRPTPAELKRMEALVARAMEAGAVGLSTGLIYVPGTYADTEEIIALAKVVARYDGVYATHMRDEGKKVLEAIEEALRIGRAAGCRVHLSHLKASGRNVWGKGREIIARLTRARKEGFPVTGDQYAYTASSTSLDVLFPAAELAVGRRAFARKLRNNESFRRRMAQALVRAAREAGFQDLSYCRIAYAPQHPDLNGLTLDEAAKRHFGHGDREHQVRLALTLMMDADGRRVSMVYHKMSEEDLATILRAPFVAVACDAGIRDPKSRAKPHPRGSGNNPRVLGRYVRERKILSLPLAIHKMTQLPAQAFRLEGRGEIRPGAWADLVVFDPETIADRATYEEPLTPPVGIDYVFVNGVLVAERGHHTGARPGKVLRHRPPG